jgi:hypothetical protein
MAAADRGQELERRFRSIFKLSRKAVEDYFATRIPRRRHSENTKVGKRERREEPPRRAQRSRGDAVVSSEIVELGPIADHNIRGSGGATVS